MYVYSLHKNGNVILCGLVIGIHAKTVYNRNINHTNRHEPTVEINDRQGNTQADIDYAVSAFMAAVTDSSDEEQDNADEQAADIAKAEQIKADFIDRIKAHVKPARVDEAIALVNSRTDAAWWIEHRDIFELCKTGKAMRFVQTGEEPEEYVSNAPHAFN